MFIKTALKHYELVQHLLHKYVHKDDGFEKLCIKMLEVIAKRVVLFSFHFFVLGSRLIVFG